MLFVSTRLLPTSVFVNQAIPVQIVQLILMNVHPIHAGMVIALTQLARFTALVMWDGLALFASLT